MDSKVRLKQMHEEISSTLEDRIDMTNYDARKSNSELDGRLPIMLTDFYKILNHLNYEWETKELVDESGIKLKGRINILKAESVLSDWKEVVYFDGDSAELKQFKIVDNFVPEAHCGFLLNGDNSDVMYYHESGEPELEPMGVDFNGYLELMFAARGFWYWQRVILNLTTGEGYGHNVEEFKTYMPQIFPDFKWEEFVALYEKVRIK